MGTREMKFYNDHVLFGNTNKEMNTWVPELCGSKVRKLKGLSWHTNGILGLVDESQNIVPQ